jgi:serine/threonine protein phosphatase 1
MELGFVGDIHGCLGELEEVVECALTRTRQLVFLGDYVNRGRHSREVIDYLIRLDKTKGVECTFIRGNHDESLLSALYTGDVDTLLRMGGAATIASYVRKPSGDIPTQLRRSVPDTHVDFLRNLVPHVTVDNVFATHAPSTAATLEGASGRYCIYGHVPQPGGVPTITGRQAFIDTGCGTTEGGRLTCLFWPKLDWVQSSHRQAFDQR